MTRRGRGRPPLPDDQRRRRVNVSLDPRAHDRWVAAAEREGLSLSEWLELAATAYLRRTQKSPASR